MSQTATIHAIPIQQYMKVLLMNSNTMMKMATYGAVLIALTIRIRMIAGIASIASQVWTEAYFWTELPKNALARVQTAIIRPHYYHLERVTQHMTVFIGLKMFLDVFI